MGHHNIPWNLFHLSFLELSFAFTLLFIDVWNLFYFVWYFPCWPEALVLESCKRKLLVHQQEKWEKYCIANWVLCCMINFLKCCKYILIMLEAFKCVSQLNLQSLYLAFLYFKVIWSYRISSSCQVPAIVLINFSLIVYLRLLLFWGEYWPKMLLTHTFYSQQGFWVVKETMQNSICALT